MTDITIGLGKAARRAASFDRIAIVPSRRTRDPEDVDLSWKIDAYRFDLPFMASAMDSVTSPATAVEMGQLGGVGVLDLEGIWARHGDAHAKLAELAEMPTPEAMIRLRELHTTPVDHDLIADRLGEIKSAGVRCAARVSPRMAVELTPVAVAADIDLLVIHSLVTSAEHVSSTTEPLNLKTFIRSLDVPVLAGGCASHRSALHLMRTGAAGVLVGIGTGASCASSSVLGIGVPQPTAIADARAARARHLDETGVYCHVIADGGMCNSGDIAKAIVLGADAVMLGAPLAASTDAPGRGWHWGPSSVHPTLPRGARVAVDPVGSLAEIINGPAHDNSGSLNLAGALRKAMAICGYTDLKAFQTAEMVGQ